MRLLIKNALLFTEEGMSQRDVFIDYGEIIEISEFIDDEPLEVIDAKGKFLLPGLIDLHTRICDPGYEYIEDIASVSKSAVKGGFTSLVASPDTHPVIDDKTVVKYIDTKSKSLSLVNIYQFGSITKGMAGKEIAEIGEMQKAGIVAISNGGKSFEDANILRNVLKYSTMFEMPVITFCEDSAIAGGGVMNQGNVSAQIGLNGIPREAEETFVSRNIILAKYCEAKIHIANVSTLGSVEIIRNAKKEGIQVTCDTCPHYFTLTEEAVSNYDTLAKVWPPLRTQKDVEGILEGLKDGTIDMISSGHTPTTIEQKKVEFDRAAFGISALETAFLISYNILVRNGHLTMPQLLQKFTLQASLLGFHGKGLLQEGYDADLFLFDPEFDTVIDSTQFASKAKFSPYHLCQVKGKVLFTIVGGKVMYLQNY